MGQKVWVIDDRDWKRTTGKRQTVDQPPEMVPTESRPLEKRPSGSRPTESRYLPEPSCKSPALSFSFSMLIWGSGHMYVGEYRPGSLYMAAMIAFYSIISGLVFFRDSVGRLVGEIEIQPSAFILGAVASFAVGLALWLGNAVAAYYRTARLGVEPYRGVENLLWPPFGSLLFPGWGQFLNGQPKKGLFFLSFGAAGIFSACVAALSFYVWPLLKPPPLRHDCEILWLSALLVIPVTVLMWLVSVYDSFRSGREQLRKRLMKHAGYRVGSRWTLRGLLPRSTAILGLMLAISLGMQFVPKNYYLETLGKLRLEMLSRNMEVMPVLVGRVIELVDR